MGVTLCNLFRWSKKIDLHNFHCFSVPSQSDNNQYYLLPGNYRKERALLPSFITDMRLLTSEPFCPNLRFSNSSKLLTIWRNFPLFIYIKLSFVPYRVPNLPPRKFNHDASHSPTAFLSTFSGHIARWSGVIGVLQPRYIRDKMTN